MEQNILQWNIENWITVLLMVALGYLLVSLVATGLNKYINSGAANNNSPSVSLTSNFNMAA